MSTDGAGGVALVALAAIVPIVVLMLTSFVKVSVVLALLRNAIGATDAPSGLVVMGVSLVLTFFVMAPVGVDMIRAAATEPAPAAPGAPDGAAQRAGPAAPAPDRTARGPAPAAPGAPDGAARGPAAAAPGAPDGAARGPAAAAPGAPDGAAQGPAAAAPGGAAERPAPGARVDVEGAVRRLVPAQYRAELDAAARAIEPLRAFLKRHAAARDRESFRDVATGMGRAVSGDELWVLAPAFLATELREAFAIAVLIFIPFLVLDLVVGLGLAALGLQSTQPQVVALPLKLLLFVAVDGWRLLLDSLLRGYA